MLPEDIGRSLALPGSERTFQTGVDTGRGGPEMRAYTPKWYEGNQVLNTVVNAGFDVINGAYFGFANPEPGKGWMGQDVYHGVVGGKDYDVNFARNSYVLATTSLTVVPEMAFGRSVSVAQTGSKIDSVISETLAGKGNFTSKLTLNSDEALNAGLKYLGKDYMEIGKPGSGVFRSSDGLRQFRIDNNSLLGGHQPFEPHFHLELYSPNSTKSLINNHIFLGD